MSTYNPGTTEHFANEISDTAQGMEEGTCTVESCPAQVAAQMSTTGAVA